MQHEQISWEQLPIIKLGAHGKVTIAIDAMASRKFHLL